MAQCGETPFSGAACNRECATNLKEAKYIRKALFMTLSVEVLQTRELGRSSGEHFASKAFIQIDPQGICPAGHSHTSLQDHSNCVLRHQIVGTRCRTYGCKRHGCRRRMQKA